MSVMMSLYSLPLESMLGCDILNIEKKVIYEYRRIIEDEELF